MLRDPLASVVRPWAAQAVAGSDPPKQYEPEGQMVQLPGPLAKYPGAHSAVEEF